MLIHPPQGRSPRNGGLGAVKSSIRNALIIQVQELQILLGIKSKKLYEQKQDFGEAKRFSLEGSNSSFVFWI